MKIQNNFKIFNKLKIKKQKNYKRFNKITMKISKKYKKIILRMLQIKFYYNLNDVIINSNYINKINKIELSVNN